MTAYKKPKGVLQVKLTLSENIRNFRKQRKMTQEKLAEALGVTVGAVYKWESGLSQPELNLIVEMADFFDTSVDVLLGYRIKDNSLDSTLDRLSQYCQTLDTTALSEAEKALGKYPHSFRVVYTCAKVYLAFGAGNHDPNYLRRALNLLEQAKVLLPQNSDPCISEAVISGDMANAWFLLGEKEKCLELLEQNNAGGIFSSGIGTCLAIYMDRPEEAASFLSQAFLNSISDLLNTIAGYVFIYRSRSDWQSALEIVQWGIDLLTGLKTETRTDYFVKAHAEMLALLAYAQARCGMTEASHNSLQKAGTYALRFDSKPDYSIQSMRFTDHMENTAIFDALGATASESVSQLLGDLGDQELAEQWKEMTGYGK